MSAAARRFAAVVRQEPVDLGMACALIGAAAQPHHDPDATLRVLDQLAAEVPPAGTADDRLRAVLGGFSGTPEDFRHLASSLLPDVLAQRRGLPILLSVVWLEVARRTDLPAYGIGLSGHFVVGLGDPDGYHVVVDPFRGGRRLSHPDLARLVGGGADPGPTSLRPWEPVEVLQRVLANIRAWAEGPDRLATRRWALELALLLPRHPLALRRELGEVRIRLGGYREGADELDTYADIVAAMDPQLAEDVRRQARSARARLN